MGLQLFRPLQTPCFHALFLQAFDSDLKALYPAFPNHNNGGYRGRDFPANRLRPHNKLMERHTDKTVIRLQEFS